MVAQGGPIMPLSLALRAHQAGQPNPNGATRYGWAATQCLVSLPLWRVLHWRCDPIATIRQDSCWRPVFALTERPRSVVNVAPVSGLGAEEETRATLIWVRAWK